MTWAVRFGAMLGMAAVIATAASSSRAQETATADRDKLKTLLRTGADAAKKKDFAACVEALTAALEIESTAARQGELGLCEEAAGRDPGAYRHLSAALHAPGADPASPSLSRVTDAFARVSARTVHVYVAVDPPQARVVIDGRPLGQAEGRSLVMTPGRHIFAARLDGYEDAVEPHDYEAGQSPTVYLSLKPKPKAAPAVSSAPSAPSAKAPAHKAEPARAAPSSVSAWFSARPERLVLAAATGLGVLTTAASGGTAIGLEIDRGSFGSKLAKTSCYNGNATLAPECAAAHERLVQRNIALNVTIGAAAVTGAAMALTGILFALDRSSPYRPSIAPTASPNGGGIIVLGNF